MNVCNYKRGQTEVEVVCHVAKPSHSAAKYYAVYVLTVVLLLLR